MVYRRPEGWGCMVYRRPLRCADIPIEEHVFASERPVGNLLPSKEQVPPVPPTQTEALLLPQWGDAKKLTCHSVGERLLTTERSNLRQVVLALNALVTTWLLFSRPINENRDHPLPLPTSPYPPPASIVYHSSHSSSHSPPSRSWYLGIRPSPRALPPYNRWPCSRRTRRP